MAGMTKGQGRQQKKNKAYYSMQRGQTDTNAKRRLRTHVRSHPLDVNAQKRYETKYKTAVNVLGLTGKGKRRLVRADDGIDVAWSTPIIAR